MFRVEVEGDKVVLALGRKTGDLLLSCGQAEHLSAALRAAAALTEKEPPSLVKGEVWDLKVESYDGKVALRFFPPVNNTAPLGQVPMPPAAARKSADAVDLKRRQAEYKMRLVLSKSCTRGVPG
jgi:hypothetical protein